MMKFRAGGERFEWLDVHREQHRAMALDITDEGIDERAGVARNKSCTTHILYMAVSFCTGRALLASVEPKTPTSGGAKDEEGTK